MGLSAVKCESYHSKILEVSIGSEKISADDFSLGENIREKVLYAAAIGASVAWAGYWLLSTPTYSEMCGHNKNNQSNVSNPENTTVEEDARCKKDDSDDGIVAVPPLLYAHYP